MQTPKIYCKSYGFNIVPHVNIAKLNLNDSRQINEISWHVLRESIFVFHGFMDKSYSLNLQSRIIQSLFIQQIKLSKSILLLTWKHDLTGEAILFRSIIEIISTIAWLIYSNNKNKFKSYIVHGLIISNNTINVLKSDVPKTKEIIPIQSRLRKSAFEEYYMAGLNKSQISKILNLSHNKIRKFYNQPNMKRRAEYFDSSDHYYFSYSTASGETHSSFPEVVNRNTYQRGNKYISNLYTNHDASEPRMMDAIALLLINSFEIMNNNSVFSINTSILNSLVRRVELLKKNLLKIEYYDEKMIQKDDPC